MECLDYPSCLPIHGSYGRPQCYNAISGKACCGISQVSFERTKVLGPFSLGDHWQKTTAAAALNWRVLERDKVNPDGVRAAGKINARARHFLDDLSLLVFKDGVGRFADQILLGVNSKPSALFHQVFVIDHPKIPTRLWRWWWLRI